MFNFLPWRYKYWVVCDARWDVLTVIRARTNPTRFRFPWWYLVAGPFDSNDDAARALSFWTRQFGLDEFAEYEGYVDPLYDDEDDEL